MAHSQATKDALRKKYIFEGLSLTMAAVVNEVSYPTAQRWKNQAEEAGDNWDQVKVAHSMAGGDNEDVARQIMMDFVIQYKTTMDILRSTLDMPPRDRVDLLASMADAYTKTVAANSRMLPKTSELAVAFKVLGLLSKFIQEHNPDLLPEFVAVLEPFGEALAKELK